MGAGRRTRRPGRAPPTSAAPAPPPPKPATLGLFVYPGSGQDSAKQGQDENECYLWARGQTGIDPTAAPPQAATPDTPKGGAVKGAARGAAKGAAVGAVSDERHVGDEGSLDAGEGAAAGAVMGRRAQKKAGKQAAQAQDTQAEETFKKAWGACLEGRGCSVKWDEDRRGESMLSTRVATGRASVAVVTALAMVFTSAAPLVAGPSPAQASGTAPATAPAKPPPAKAAPAEAAPAAPVDS